MSNDPKAVTKPLHNTKTVAATMGLHPRSLTEWANRGRYKVKRTPGGHYRFEVDADGWPIEVKR